MNRISMHSISGGRSTLTEPQQHRRGRSLAGPGGRGASREGEESLDLFSRSRSDLLITSAADSGDQNEPIKLERIRVGSAKTGRSVMEDLLDADIGKHDYDWLLTPPGTPLFPSSDAIEKISSPAPRNSSTVRSVSTTRPSRLSTTQLENGHSTRPVRSSSVSRPSISSNYSSIYISNSNRTSVLNTSSASVTSRPSTPGNRSTSQSTVRASLASGPARSRPSTPSRTRPPPNSTGDKVRPLNNSRPSTPTARPRTPTNSNSTLNSSVARSTSRPSTPTRRSPQAAPTPIPGRSPSVGRIPSVNGRSPAPVSRPGSPGPRARPPVRPLDLPDFPLDVPPNLKTKLPERPLSTGRTRPGTALTVRANSNSEAPIPASSHRRLSLPIVSRGKFPENPPKARPLSNGQDATSPEIQKPAASEANGVRRPSKPATATESTGFGRTISKKSLDMALRHMDIRQSMGGVRGASLFPQSIRTASSKGRRASMSGPIVPVMNDEADAENDNCDGTISILTGCNGAVSSDREGIAARSPESEYGVTMAGELDLYGSTRYEAMLLKEDSRNMNWLHSVEDKSDQGPVFDHRFEPLPEPFGLL